MSDGLVNFIFGKPELFICLLYTSTGETGNISSAELVPIQEIEGLTSAKITGVVVNGEDMESEDDFRERYFSLSLIHI